jgi:arginase family enzyme
VPRDVAESSEPVVVLSGACMTALTVLAGLQQAGANAALLWFEAPGDLQTERTTTSGYLEASWIPRGPSGSARSFSHRWRV